MDDFFLNAYTMYIMYVWMIFFMGKYIYEDVIFFFLKMHL